MGLRADVKPVASGDHVAMNVLVAYASKRGSTAEIAEVVAEALRRQGLSVDCRSVETVDSLDLYDAVVLGSAVYMKRWLRPARRFLKHQADALSRRPLWIFSSGPCGEKPDPSWSETHRLVNTAERLGARDHVVFGGRLPLEPGNVMERSMVENTPPEHRDERDWEQIRDWAIGIARVLGAERPLAAARSA